MTSGGLIVRWAQASHLLMWTSVPQMEVLRILIRTSLRPGEGTGTSVMIRPGAAVGLTMARIFVGMGGNVGTGFPETTANAAACPPISWCRVIAKDTNWRLTGKAATGAHASRSSRVWDPYACGRVF